MVVETNDRKNRETLTIMGLDPPKIASQNPQKDLLELLIGKSIHERIDRRIEIAEKIATHSGRGFKILNA